MKQKNKIARRARQRTFKYFLFVMAVYAAVYGCGILLLKWVDLIVSVHPLITLVYGILLFFISWVITNQLMRNKTVIGWIKTF